MVNKQLYVIILLIFSIQQGFAQNEYNKAIHQSSFVFTNSTTIEVETPYNDVYLYACPPYPIPSKEFINFLIYWDKRYNFDKAEINIYNTEGIKICSKERISTSQQSDWSSIVTWNASGFPNGIYIILIRHVSKTISVKVAIG